VSGERAVQMESADVCERAGGKERTDAESGPQSLSALATTGALTDHENDFTTEPSRTRDVKRYCTDRP
jgi:hypothetical protein